MAYYHILLCLLIGSAIITAEEYSVEDSREYYDKVTFEISGRDLPSQMIDTIDPFIKVFETSETRVKPILVGSTEVIQNNANPDFDKLITFPWNKGSNQLLTFVLMDENPLRNSQIGEVGIWADELVEGSAGGMKLRLKKGTIIVRKVEPLKFKLESVFHKAEGVQGNPFMEYYWRRGPKGVEKLIQTGIKFDKRLRTFTMKGNTNFPRYFPNSGAELVFKVRTELDQNELSTAVVPIDALVENRTFSSKETKNDKGTFTVTLSLD